MFPARQAQAALEAALAGLGDPEEPATPLAAGSDFPVPAGPSAVIVSVRPLPQPDCEPRVLVFVRDPLAAEPDPRLLGTVLGLTLSEARLAAALARGTTLPVYARARGISINTAYTHLRHLKDKTGTRRLTELTRALNGVGRALARFPGRISD